MKKTVMAVLPYFAILLIAAVIIYVLFGTGNKVSDDDLSGNAEFDITELPSEYLLTGDDIKEADPSSDDTVVLSGDYSETVVIDAKDRIVHLLLDNANISTNDGPAVYIRSAAKVVMTVKDGTENTLSDSAYYSDQDLSAAVLSDADLTINGKGTLNISGFRKDAVRTDRVLKIVDTTVRIKAKRDAIDADDGMLLMAGRLVAEAERDALTSDRHKKESKGNIYILGGSNELIAGKTGIRSGADLYISSCTVSIKSVIKDIDTVGSRFIGEGCL